MKQAMIFAAGLGTRLKPLTDTMPKALVTVAGKSLLDRTIERLVSFGYGRLVVNVHHFAEQVVAHVAGNEAYRLLVRISDERECLLDTGGGLRKSAPLFAADEPILIHNVDILDNVDYDWFSRCHTADEDAVLLVSRRKTQRYLLFDDAMQLQGWVNVQTGEVRSPHAWLRTADHTIEDYRFHAEGTTFTMYAFSGIHSFSPRLFPLMDGFPEKFGIMDFYLQVCHRARVVGCVKADLQVLDVGKSDSLAQAEAYVIAL